MKVSEMTKTVQGLEELGKQRVCETQGDREVAQGSFQPGLLRKWCKSLEARRRS